MKLKKIAALALAGVMAVSMLAGCGSNKPDPDPNPDEGTTTTTGYSAQVGAVVDTKLDYVTFKDSTADQAALQKFVDGIGSQALENYAHDYAVVNDLGNTTSPTLKAKVEDLGKDLKIVDMMNTICLNLGSYAKQETAAGKLNASGVRAAAVYAVNGAVTTKSALEQVANQIDAQIEMLKDKSTGATTGWDYTYEVSVSVTTKTQQDNYALANNAVTFILVTVNRTVTNA